MGGYGSGPCGLWKKNKVEECVSLSVDTLARKGFIHSDQHSYGTLTWSNTFTGEKISSCGYEVNTLNQSVSWFRVFYTITRTEEKIDYTIHLTATEPHFGGIACGLPVLL